MRKGWSGGVPGRVVFVHGSPVEMCKIDSSFVTEPVGTIPPSHVQIAPSVPTTTTLTKSNRFHHDWKQLPRAGHRRIRTNRMVCRKPTTTMLSYGRHFYESYSARQSPARSGKLLLAKEVKFDARTGPHPRDKFALHG